MGFETPLLLIGLLGGLLPIAIHLYLRKNAQVEDMDAVMRLVLAGGKMHLRLRLVHGLLLTARVLIATVLVLLFAQPYLKRPVVAGVAAEHPVALAVVLDNSLSMRLAAGGEPGWSRARSHVLRTLAELPAESEVFVVLAGRPVEAYPASAPGWDADTAARYVGRLAAGRGGTDVAAAVRTAARLVRASPHADRRLLVASDFFDHGLAGFPAADELAGIVTVPVDVGPAGPPANRSVAEAVAVAAPDVSPSHVRVRVVVENGSDTAFDDVVTVRLGRNSTARKVTCGPHGRCAAEFLLPAEDPVAFGEARLPPDDLPDDDVRWFSLSPRNRYGVLLVDGAPSRRPDLDEAFFLARALPLRPGDGPGFAVTVVRPEELSPLHLAAVGSAALLNVPRLLPEQVKAVADFVASGGGLLVTLGDAATVAGWRALAPDLLPAPLRDVVDVGGGGREGVTLGWAAPDHPALQGLAEGPGSLGTALFRRFGVLEDGWPDGTRTLATMSNGLPLLVERRVGRGTLAVLLTSIDRDWTDLPLRPAFAPFVHRLFTHLRAAGGTAARATLEVGEARRVEVPEGFSHAVVRPPAGPAVRFAASDDFYGTLVPGAYRIELYGLGRADPIRTETFVVNTAPAESTLARVTGVPPSLTQAGPGAASDTAPFRKVGLWPHLLVFVLALFLAEAYLRGKA